MAFINSSNVVVLCVVLDFLAELVDRLHLVLSLETSFLPLYLAVVPKDLFGLARGVPLEALTWPKISLMRSIDFMRTALASSLPAMSLDLGFRPAFSFTAEMQMSDTCFQLRSSLSLL